MSTRKFLPFLLVIAIILAVAPAAFARQHGADGASVNLSVKQDKYAANQDVLVSVTLSNPTDHVLSVLKWYTPVDGVQEDLLAVTRNGDKSVFMGGHYKRSAPTSADYFTLKPGASVVREINLGVNYDLSVSGQYTLRYNAGSFNLYNEGVGGEGTLSSNEVSIWVEGRGQASTEFGMPALDSITAGTTSFLSCSSTRQTQLTTARSNARTYATNAVNYLTAGTTGSRYTYWFGTYTSSRYNSVKSHFNSIKNAMDNANITFNCGCTDSAYAYVYPSQPYTIYLCNAFWSAPATGTDSKAGTLIHEMSHFNVVASTDDWAYGQSAAHSLAVSNPSKAVDNADSHEYFAENNPSRP